MIFGLMFVIIILLSISLVRCITFSIRSHKIKNIIYLIFIILTTIVLAVYMYTIVKFMLYFY